MMKRLSAIVLLLAVAACDSGKVEPVKVEEKPQPKPFPLDSKSIVTQEDLEAIGVSIHDHFKDKGAEWLEINKIESGYQLRGTCNEGDLEVEIVALADAAAAAERCDSQLKQERTRKEISDAKPGRTFGYEVGEEKVVGEKGWTAEYLRKEGDGFGVAKVMFQRKEFFVKAMWSGAATDKSQMEPIRKVAADLAGRLEGKLQ